MRVPTNSFSVARRAKGTLTRCGSEFQERHEFGRLFFETQHSIEPLHCIGASCQAVVWLGADSVERPSNERILTVGWNCRNPSACLCKRKAPAGESGLWDERRRGVRGWGLPSVRYVNSWPAIRLLSQQTKKAALESPGFRRGSLARLDDIERLAAAYESALRILRIE
jgi:hypothetical protein